MKKSVIKCLVASIFASSIIFSLSIASLAWFARPGGEADDNLDGKVGLRSYFYAGDGTYDNPYEIVSPVHFYNLTRLQNLGVFQGENPNDTVDGKWHFQVGHDFNDDGQLYCVNEYDALGNPKPVKYLDMATFSNVTILPIGGEGAPFYGIFDGKGLPIVNLTVSGYPEDIGVFGYVAHTGVVKGLVCKDLTICSLGYNSDHNDKSYKLFNQDIDDIFESASFLATETRLHFYKWVTSSYVEQGVPQVDDGNGLTRKNASGTLIEEINNPSNLIPNTNYYKGYFDIDYPSQNHYTQYPFTYSWKSSSPLIKEYAEYPGVTGTNVPPIVFDLDTLKNSDSFNSGVPTQIDAKLSLIATVEVDGFVFSRVIQSYTCEFLSNSTGYDGWVKKGAVTQGASETPTVTNNNYYYDSNLGKLFVKVSNVWNEVDRFFTGTTAPVRSTERPTDTTIYVDTTNNMVYEFVDDYYDVKIFCDYQADDYEANYHHGNNIGFLAGHVDGTIEQSYVYNGTFKFNDSEHEWIGSETETGLVGEIGTNVVNSIDPNIGLKIHGETGVMNFSRIYSLIRNDAEVGQNVYGGQISGINYMSYEPFINEETFGSFSNYLRYATNQKHNNHYIVDVNKNMKGDSMFHNDKSIEASDISSDADFGKINSVDFLWNKVIEDENGIDRGLGVFKIVSSYNKGAKTGNYGPHMLENIGSCKIVNGKTKKQKVYFSTAEYNHEADNSDHSEFEPYRATSTPSYFDTKSFDYPFSRDYNYCFELDMTQREQSGRNNHMYNTDNEFLAYYLYTKLYNERHEHIKPEDQQFGFMFRSSEDVVLDGLSSYMEVSNTLTKEDFGSDYYIKTGEENENPSLYLKETVTSGVDINKRIWTECTGNNICYGSNNTAASGKYRIDVDSGTGNITLYSSVLDNGSYIWSEILSENILIGKDAPSEDLSIRCYPSNSIVFRIENPNGANVSVIGNGGDITIYKNNTKTMDNPTPFYSMKSAAPSGNDSHRYFEYNFLGNLPNDNKNTGTTAKVYSGMSGDGGALYAHIFFLPAGDYVVGGRTGTAKVYFLSVQGQTEGTIGAIDKADDIGGAITDCDFLLTDPINQDGTLNTSPVLANFSFISNFAKLSGDFSVKVVDDRLSLRFINNGLLTSLATYSYGTNTLTYDINIDDVYNTSVNYTSKLYGGT